MPALLYGGETSVPKEQVKPRMATEEMKGFRKPSKYALFGQRRNHGVLK
jgi:hypothetical protein